MNIIQQYQEQFKEQLADYSEKLKAYPEITKKTLEEVSGKSDNTTYDTIKAVLLPTAAKVYTHDEAMRFALGRILIENGGKKYDEISTIFAECNTAKRDAQATAASHKSLQQGVFDTANAAIKAAVRGLRPYVPGMILDAIHEEFSSEDFTQELDTLDAEIEAEMDQFLAAYKPSVLKGSKNVVLQLPKSNTP